MSKKEIEFKVKFDTSELEKGFNEVQKKASQINSYSDQMKAQMATSQRLQTMGMVGILNMPNADAMKRATDKAKKDLDALIVTQAKAQRDMDVLIAKHSQGIDNLVKKNQSLLQGSKDQLDVEEQINAAISNRANLSKQYKLQDDALNKLIDQREKMEGRGGPPKTPTGGQGGGGSDRGFLAGLPKILSAVGAALGSGAEIYRQIYESPIRTQIATGAAVQGTYGRELEAKAAGRGVYESAFLPERLRAAQMAGNLSQSNRIYDKLLFGGGLAGVAGGVAAAGTGIGAIPGIASAIGGAGALFGSQRMRAYSGGQFAGALGDVTQSFTGGAPNPVSNFFRNVESGQMKQYNALMAQDFAENFNKSLQAEIETNPLKNMAAQYYDSHLMQNLEAQRSLGLNQQSFYGQGGYLGRVQGAGFTNEMGLQASNQILAAGGSTRMAQQSQLGLQAARGVGLTNANQVLGMLSGNFGSAQTSNQTMIDLLARSFSKGLDDSEYAEENRKFVQTTAELITKAGVTSPEAARRIEANFAGFAAEPQTMAGQRAARGAYETITAAQGETAGPRGVQRAAGMFSDPVLGQLDQVGLNALAQIPADQVSEDHPNIVSVARRLKVSPKEVVSRLRGINAKSATRFAETDKLVEQGRSIKSKLQNTPAASAEYGKLNEQLQEVSGRLGEYVTAEFPGLAQGEGGGRRVEAGVQGLLSLNQQESKKTMEDLEKQRDIVQKKIESKETGRAEDKSVALLAEDAKMLTTQFNAFSKEIVRSAQEQARWNDLLVQSIGVMQKAVSEGKMSEGQLKDYYRKLNAGLGFGPKEQTQGGKGAPGH